MCPGQKCDESNHSIPDCESSLEHPDKNPHLIQPLQTVIDVGCDKLNGISPLFWTAPPYMWRLLCQCTQPTPRKMHSTRTNHRRQTLRISVSGRNHSHMNTYTIRQTSPNLNIIAILKALLSTSSGTIHHFHLRARPTIDASSRRATHRVLTPGN